MNIPVDVDTIEIPYAGDTPLSHRLPAPGSRGRPIPLVRVNGPLEAAAAAAQARLAGFDPVFARPARKTAPK